MQGKDLTIYGDGKQTRSFQYVDDLVDGLMKLMESDEILPVNIGNPREMTIKTFASIIQDKIGTNNPSGKKVNIVHLKSTKGTFKSNAFFLLFARNSKTKAAILLFFHFIDLLFFFHCNCCCC